MSSRCHLKGAMSLALLVLTMLSACAQSAVRPAAERPDQTARVAKVLPVLKSESRLPCTLPDVPDFIDAYDSAAQHRVALIECRQKHLAAVAHGDELVRVIRAGQQAEK